MKKKKKKKRYEVQRTILPSGNIALPTITANYINHPETCLSTPPSSATSDASPCIPPAHIHASSTATPVGACYSGSGTREKLIPCRKTEVDFNDRRKVTYVRPYPDRKLGRTLRGSRSGRIRSAFPHLRPSVCLSCARNARKCIRSEDQRTRLTHFIRFTSFTKIPARRDYSE
jgi:hypothetical protein